MTSQPGWFLRVTMICLGTFGLLMTSLPAQDVESEPTTPYKIGVVDLSSLIKDNAKRMKRYDELKAEVKKRQVPLDKNLAAWEMKRKRWETERDNMTEEERLELKIEIEEEGRAHQSEVDKEQRYIDNLEKKVLREAIEDIQIAIKMIATKENFHLVLNAKSDPPRGYPFFSVLYHSPTIDITSKVLELLNTP